MLWRPWSSCLRSTGIQLALTQTANDSSAVNSRSNSLPAFVLSCKLLWVWSMHMWFWDQPETWADFMHRTWVIPLWLSSLQYSPLTSGGFLSKFSLRYALSWLQFLPNFKYPTKSACFWWLPRALRAFIFYLEFVVITWRRGILLGIYSSQTHLHTGFRLISIIPVCSYTYL